VLAAAAQAFVGSVNSGPAGAYAVYVNAEAKVTGKSAAVLGDPAKSPPHKWVVSSGEPFLLPAGNGALRLEYLTLPASALRVGDGASLSVEGVVFAGGSVALSGKAAKGWLQGRAFVKASLSVSRGRMEVAKSKGSLVWLSGTGAALTFDSPDFGSIDALSVSDGELKFSGAKTVVKDVSVTNGGDVGVLSGVVMAGAMAVSGKGSKLGVSGSSGTIISIVGLPVATFL